MTVVDIRTGWPPHMVAHWSGWHWIIAVDPADPPTLADDGPPGTEWIFSEDEAIAHAPDGWLTSVFRWTFRIPLIDGSGTWFVPEGLYDGSFTMTAFRCTFLGRLNGEIWQSTHALNSSHTAQQVADAIAAHKLTIGQWIADWCPTTVSWDAVKVSAFDVATGANTGEVGEAAISIPGAVESHSLPNECAVVATLRTTHARVHGRMYFPTVAVTALGADGNLLDACTAELALKMKTYFNALSADAIAGGPAVYSTTGHLTRDVVSVDVGNVVDSQRRRRNRLVEARNSQSL